MEEEEERQSQLECEGLEKRATSSTRRETRRPKKRNEKTHHSNGDLEILDSVLNQLDLFLVSSIHSLEGVEKEESGLGIEKLELSREEEKVERRGIGFESFRSLSVDGKDLFATVGVTTERGERGISFRTGLGNEERRRE